ncbi:outer membrane protein [Bradyrhizobium sp. 2TAF24]|uniref:outer membrane protein n=1 Tax=Bradyrhizobium sp. 2TAF24 TaxID=3233011 RepID=UPI003F931EFA
MPAPHPLAVSAAVTTLLAVTAAQAEPFDRSWLSPAPIASSASFSWRGGYAGLHGGFARFSADNLAPAQGGYLAGAQGGYNVQVSGSTVPAVFGIELEGSYLWRQTSRPQTAAGSIAPRWIGAAKLRTGIVLGRFLPYATAGLALVHSEEPVADGRGWQIGYLYGGGLEYAVTDTVSIKAEYNYLQLGRTPSDNRLEFMSSRPLTAQTIKAGANIRF